MESNFDIVRLAKENSFFRKELATGAHSQVVLMSVPPGEEIGEEVHRVDQTLVFVEGNGLAALDGAESPVGPGSLIFVRAGTKHNFKNTGSADLKLYTIYAPPQHKPGIACRTKAEAEASKEHY